MKAGCYNAVFVFLTLTFFFIFEPVSSADYAVATTECTIYLTKDQSCPLPVGSTFRVLKTKDKWFYVETVGKNPVKGNVSVTQINKYDGNLPSAEDAFLIALRSIQQNDWRNAICMSFAAQAQLPGEKSYDESRKLAYDVFVTATALQQEINKANKIVAEMENKKNNARAQGQASTFRDRNSQPNQAQTAQRFAQQQTGDAERQIKEAVSKVIKTQAAFRLLFNKINIYIQNELKNGNYDVAVAWHDALKLAGSKYVFNAEITKLQKSCGNSGEYSSFSREDTFASSSSEYSGSEYTIENAKKIIAEVQNILALAEQANNKGNLVEATQRTKQALAKWPANRKALTIQSAVEPKLTMIHAQTQQAEALMNQKQFDAAYTIATNMITACLDDDKLNSIHDSLKKTIDGRANKLMQATVNEKAGQYEEAYKTFSFYGMTNDSRRTVLSYGKQMEIGGNNLGAYSLYQDNGLPDEMRRVSAGVEKQKRDYMSAKLLIAENKHDAALDVYRQYNDMQAINYALSLKAANLESTGNYAGAVETYRLANSEKDITRISRLIKDREKWLTEAKNFETAAKYDAAIGLYAQANAEEEVKRLAGNLAKKLETEKQYSKAADYFEIAKNWAEAGRIRKLNKLEEVRGGQSMAPEEIFKMCAPGTVSICTRTVVSTRRGLGMRSGLGSGFFISKDGYLLTNNHVVEKCSEVSVISADGKEYVGKVVETAPDIDVALIKVDGAIFPYLKLGDSDKIQVGASVVAIGTPETLNLSQSMTQGIISSKERKYSGIPAFQTSALINHGNSGGPLIDMYGQVVGITFAGLGTAAMTEEGNIGSDIQGINFAIKINEAKALLTKKGLQ